MPPPAAGRIYLGKYESVRLLGEGGMGAVFLARALQTDQPVVVKVMHEHIAREQQFRASFEREIALMAAFNHENAVAFIDAGADPNGPCLVMEFAPGITLDKLIAKNTRFSPMRIRRILAQMCDVLQAAHDAGIIHRDLKPVNLMILDPDTPFEKLKVMDFGLAEMTGPPEPGAQRQYAVGTPGYMSPEQVAGNPVDHRGDLYSVGVILFQLLSGRMPFAGQSTMEILMEQATTPPPTFADLGMEDKVAAPVEAVIRSCLAIEPSERPQSARELGEAYEAALREGYGRPTPAKPAATPAFTPPSFAPAAGAVDPNAHVETLEVNVPEAILAYKVKASTEEVGGKVLESKPGSIRLRFPAPKKGTGSGGLLSMLGLGRRGVGTIDVELLIQRDASNTSLLNITLLFRPEGGGKAPTDADWRARCQQIHRALKGFLGSRT